MICKVQFSMFEILLYCQLFLKLQIQIKKTTSVTFAIRTINSCVNMLPLKATMGLYKDFAKGLVIYSGALNLVGFDVNGNETKSTHQRYYVSPIF